MERERGMKKIMLLALTLVKIILMLQYFINRKKYGQTPETVYILFRKVQIKPTQKIEGH